MTDRNDPRSFHRTKLSHREALLFEAGIKLGGVFHQYLGIPVTTRTARDLGRAIERAISLQPFVESVSVRIRPRLGPRPGRGPLSYQYLTAEMLEAVVTLEHRGLRVTARLRHEPDLRYSLMRVERITERRSTARAR